MRSLGKFTRTTGTRHLHQPFPDRGPVLSPRPNRARRSSSSASLATSAFTVPTLVPPFRPIPTNSDQFRPNPTEKKVFFLFAILRLFAAFCAQNLSPVPAHGPPIPHSSFSKMVLFETKHPRVKMRRLAISNLQREKWYSTIFQRPAFSAISAVSCSPQK